MSAGPRTRWVLAVTSSLVVLVAAALVAWRLVPGDTGDDLGEPGAPGPDGTTQIGFGLVMRVSDGWRSTTCPDRPGTYWSLPATDPCVEDSTGWVLIDRVRDSGPRRDDDSFAGVSTAQHGLVVKRAEPTCLLSAIGDCGAGLRVRDAGAVVLASWHDGGTASPTTAEITTILDSVGPLDR